MKTRPMIILLGALAPLACQGEQGKATVADSPIEQREGPQIDQASAKRLAAVRYRELFEGKFLFDSTGRTYHPMPAVTESDFNRVESVGSSWLVAIHRPAGLEVQARVAKDGSWTELLRAHWASD
jgi:hypothetical protein